MRWLGRLLLLGTLVLAGVWGWQRWGHLARLPEPAVVPAEPPATAAMRATTTYLLDRERWTEFPLVTPFKQLRILSNAEASPEGLEAAQNRNRHLPEGEADYLYTLAYRAVDDQGELLREGVFQHDSRRRIYRDPASGRLYPTASRYPPDYLPLDSRFFHLNMAGWGDSVSLQLRIAAAPPPIERVAVRVFQDSRQRLGAPLVRWQRLSAEQRERLAAASVYPPELLSDLERIQLISDRRVRLSPLGVEGQDYREERLYVIDEHDGEEVLPPVPPMGALFQPGRPLLLEIPPGEGLLRLEMTPTEPDQAGGVVDFHWYGRPATRQRRWRIPWEGGVLEYATALEEGLLEVVAPLAGGLRAWYRPDGEAETEITPQPAYLRLYRLDVGSPLVYEIAHLEGEATPLRLDLRTITGAAVGLDYTLLDAQGEPVGGGVLEGESAPPSRYDRFADLPEQAIGNPQRHYLLIPPAGQRLRLSASGPLLIAAYSRSPRLAQRRVVPDHPLTPESTPAWFPLHPADRESRRRQGATRLAVVQPRPPEVEPELLAGRYRWESLLPEGQWRGRYLLTPAPDAPDKTASPSEPLIRPGALDSLFAELEGERKLTFPDPYSMGEVATRLIYFRATPEPADVRILLDGKPHFQGRMTATQGEITLPSFTPGTHELRAEGSGRFLISGALEGGYRKRLALRLSEQMLRFPFRKGEGAEVLSLRLYSPPDSGEHRLRLRIAGGPPRGGLHHRDWTLRERQVVVRPDRRAEVAVLQGGGEQLDAGRLFFLPLGSDLPPGEYWIEVEPQTGNGGYLVLSRTLPGEFDHWRFHYD